MCWMEEKFRMHVVDHLSDLITEYMSTNRHTLCSL